MLSGVAMSPDDMDESDAWNARRQTSRRPGGTYRLIARAQSFIVAFWVVVGVLLLVLRETEAAAPFLGLAVLQGLVLLIIRRYRPVETP
jgi:hypothetical protein